MAAQLLPSGVVHSGEKLTWQHNHYLLGDSIADVTKCGYASLGILWSEQWCGSIYQYGHTNPTFSESRHPEKIPMAT